MGLGSESGDAFGGGAGDEKGTAASEGGGRSGGNTDGSDKSGINIVANTVASMTLSSDDAYQIAVDKKIADPNNPISIPNDTIKNRAGNFVRGMIAHITDPREAGMDAVKGAVFGGGPVGAAVGVVGGTLKAGMSAATGPGFSGKVSDVYGGSSETNNTSGASFSESYKDLANEATRSEKLGILNTTTNLTPEESPVDPGTEISGTGEGTAVPSIVVPRIRDNIRQQLIRKYQVA